MKKPLIFILILAILFCVAYYVGRTPNIIKPPVPVVEEVKTFPYIENDILYTEKRELPLAYITEVLIYDVTIRYVAICWRNGRYSGGIFTMQMWEYMKIRPELERYYATHKSPKFRNG